MERNSQRRGIGIIYTVTLNPSLDYIVDVENFRPGMTNRSVAEYILPGGKGINVSLVLKNLGIDSIAMGFVAGFTGDEIVRRLEGTGILWWPDLWQVGWRRENMVMHSAWG